MLGRPVKRGMLLGLTIGGLASALWACRPLPTREPPPEASSEPPPALVPPPALDSASATTAPAPALDRYEHPRVEPDELFDREYRVEPEDEAQRVLLAVLRECLRHDPPGRWVDAVVTVDTDAGIVEVSEFVDPDLDPARRQIPGSLYACVAAGAADRVPGPAAFSKHVELRALRIEPLAEPLHPPPLPPVDEIPRSFELTPEHLPSLAAKALGPIHECATKTGLARDLELDLTFGWEGKQAIASASASGAPAATLRCLDARMAAEVGPYLAARYRRNAPSAIHHGHYRVVAADAFYIRPIATRAEIVRRVTQHLHDTFRACRIARFPPRQKVYVATNQAAQHFRWSADPELRRRAGAALPCVVERTDGDRLDRLFPDLSPPAGSLRLEVRLDPTRGRAAPTPAAPR